MIVTPLRPQTPRPVTLLRPGYKSLTALTPDSILHASGPQRCYDLLAKLGSHALYVSGSVKPLLTCTGATAWTGDVWRGKATALRLYGTSAKVTSLRRSLEGMELDAAYDALRDLTDALADRGIRAGSVSSMAWSLWRSTLEAPVEISSRPSLGRAALFGGRQESVRPTKFADPFVAVDLKRAYPTEMAARPYAGTLREVSRETALDPGVAGLCEATVTTPEDLDHPFACLPVRVGPEMIQWQWGTTTGVWPWCELVAARDLGCDVTVRRVWAPLTTLDLFARWDQLAGRLEEMIGEGVRLLKPVLNSLWGVFALNGDDRATVTWSDDHGYHPEVVATTPLRLPHARSAHVAAETTARVRVRLLREALYGGIGEPVHIDTDGYLVRASSAASIGPSATPGSWRRKTEMRILEVRGPQLYRYLCGEGCGITHAKWHVVASGVPHAEAREFFERSAGRVMLPVTGFDVVLPSGRPLDPAQVRRYRATAQIQRTMAFGEAL